MITYIILLLVLPICLVLGFLSRGSKRLSLFLLSVCTLVFLLATTMILLETLELKHFWGTVDPQGPVIFLIAVIFSFLFGILQLFLHIHPMQKVFPFLFPVICIFVGNLSVVAAFVISGLTATASGYLFFLGYHSIKEMKGKS